MFILESRTCSSDGEFIISSIYDRVPTQTHIFFNSGITVGTSAISEAVGAAGLSAPILNTSFT